MTDRASERAEMVRYLLGDSSEDERLRVEGGYFGDPEYYQRLLEVEDDLAYHWVRGELTQDQRERFGQRLRSSSTGRKKAAFAEALTEVASRLQAQTRIPAPVTSWRKLWISNVPAGMPIAAGLVVAVFAWQSFQLRQMNRQMRNLTAQLETEHKSRESERVTATQSTAPVTVSFFLTPGLTRGAEQLRRLQIPTNAAAVRLQLMLRAAESSRLFQAIVRTAGGREVWNQTGLRNSATGASPTIELNVPASVLASEEYDVVLQGQRPDGGWEELGSYHFGVAR